MRAIIRHRHSPEQENRTAARTFPADQHGQRRVPSRCVGVPRRPSGAAHALVRGPARDGVAIASRRTSRVLASLAPCSGSYTPAVSAGTAFERRFIGCMVAKSLILFTLCNFTHLRMKVSGAA